MLDNNRDRVARVLDRRIADKQRVITLLPGAFDVFGDAGLTLFLGDPLDLDCAGFA